MFQLLKLCHQHVSGSIKVPHLRWRPGCCSSRTPRYTCEETAAAAKLSVSDSFCRKQAHQIETSSDPEPDSAAVSWSGLQTLLNSGPSQVLRVGSLNVFSFYCFVCLLQASKHKDVVFVDSLLVNKTNFGLVSGFQWSQFRFRRVSAEGQPEASLYKIYMLRYFDSLNQETPERWTAESCSDTNVGADADSLQINVSPAGISQVYTAAIYLIQ